MNPTVIGVVVITCTFAGALLGKWLRTTLPEHHLDAEAKDTVKVVIGLISSITALVLGLVISSAKSSFDAAVTAVKQTSTEVLTLDRVLARYGSETGEIRKNLKDTIGNRIDMIWPHIASTPVNLEALASGEWLLGTEQLADAIQDLQPHDDSQRALQKRALELAEAMLKARWLVTDGTRTANPVPFLAVVVSWLTIIFVSFGLLAPRNATVLTVIFFCALAVGSAMFLILELDGPFDGLIQVSPNPLRYAVAHLNQ